MLSLELPFTLLSPPVAVSICSSVSGKGAMLCERGLRGQQEQVTIVGGSMPSAAGLLGRSIAPYCPRYPNAARGASARTNLVVADCSKRDCR
jgi:hypothetical protein